MRTYVERELTSKKWKKVKIVAGCIVASSLFIGPALGGSNFNAQIGGIFGIFFIGAIVMIMLKT